MSIENSIACIFPAVLFVANSIVLLSGLKPVSESYSLHMPHSAASMESKTDPRETVTWMPLNYMQRWNFSTSPIFTDKYSSCGALSTFYSLYFPSSCRTGRLSSILVSGSADPWHQSPGLCRGSLDELHYSKFHQHSHNFLHCFIAISPLSHSLRKCCSSHWQWFPAWSIRL